jgi:hypothetical protein
MEVPMAQLEPKANLPPWTWQDVEQTLYSLAETPNQSMVAHHFLANLSRDLPVDARTVLLELMHITKVMHALEPDTTGTDPHQPQRLHG